MNATQRDEQRFAQYSARKVEAYEALVEEATGALDMMETEAFQKLMTVEKHRLSKKIASAEEYIKRHSVIS